MSSATDNGVQWNTSLCRVKYFALIALIVENSSYTTYCICLDCSELTFPLISIGCKLRSVETCVPCVGHRLISTAPHSTFETWGNLF
jgi:hypothetical protein